MAEEDTLMPDLKPHKFNPPDGHFVRYADDDRHWKRAVLEFMPLIEQYLIEGYEIDYEVRLHNTLALIVRSPHTERVYRKEYRRLEAKGRHARRMTRPPKRVARAFARYVRSQGLSTKTTKHVWEERD